ncbi:uncharacterized protein OSCP1 [Eurosta solidaginis]|uniref:uncharacterized protein OSCP1 n=1 Tax=Eurosta solidaginis TaxID=178769 RepID=UPI003530DFA6
MASLSRQCNPRANVFLMVNLGCEMLYVIDQRLKAQQISEEKSIQVIHDVTVVLLEPKFIDSLIVGSMNENSQLLTADHCKYMLNDVATSSIMRLDKSSMDKLWNLMTMIYKWQLFIAKNPQNLLDITFRHLDGISLLRPDDKRTMLVDFTKNVLLDFWNVLDDEGQWGVYHTQKAWLQCFNTKISLLIRLGFQALDGTFRRSVEASYYREFAETIGDNVYVKNIEQQGQEDSSRTYGAAKNSVVQLADLLNLSQADNEELQPIDANNFQKQFEQNLQQCNILFVDMDVNEATSSSYMSKPCDNEVQVKSERESSEENDFFAGSELPDSSTMLPSKAIMQGGFVQLPALYTRHMDGGRANVLNGLNRDLLDLYSQLL